MRTPELRRTPLLAVVLSSLATLVASAACEDDTAAVPPVEFGSGDVTVSVELAPFVVIIRDRAGKERLRTIGGGGDEPYGAPALTRDDGRDATNILPGWDGYVPSERAWVHGGGARLVSRTASSASFELAAGSGSVTVDVAVEGRKVRLVTSGRADLPPADEWNKATVAFALRPDEHFFGLGERFASVDHRGISMYSWPEEGGTGAGEGAARSATNPFPNGPSMTYFPVPFFLSSAGYAMHLATTRRTETHFGSEREDAFRVAVNGTSLEAVVYVEDDPLASLDAFTRDTGRPMVPATWVFGPRRRVSNGDQALGMEEWRALRERHVPTTGLDDAVHFLPARSEVGREEELRSWVNTVHAAGFKVMAYNNPYISMSIERAKDDLAYGQQNGLLALTPEGKLGETFFISGEPQTLATIDLTKPEAVTWFQDLLRRTLAFGYDGWMHDFGEYVRRPWRFADGRTGEEVHNEFPVLSAKAAYDLLSKEKPDDFLFFVRAGYTGSQQYVPAVWSGDPEATFDETQGLPSVVRGGLNLGMSGVPLWGSDVTGFKCLTEYPNDKEMVLRWAEFGAVSPIMMEQNACSNPLERKRKWKLWDDDETIAVYGAMARIHTRLAPYFEVLAREAHASGIPIMRHPFLYHPTEAEAWKAESSFYLGGALFTSPVVARGAMQKETWLPPGRWVDVFDHAVYEGGRRVVLPAPLAKLPLMIKSGTLVPLLDAAVESLVASTDPAIVTAPSTRDRLEVLTALAPNEEARFVLADGTELVARRAVASVAPSGFPEVPDDQLATCSAGCFARTREAAVDRLRIVTPLANDATTTHDDVVVSIKGPSARRIQWDILALR